MPVSWILATPNWKCTIIHDVQWRKSVKINFTFLHNNVQLQMQIQNKCFYDKVRSSSIIIVVNIRLGPAHETCVEFIIADRQILENKNMNEMQ